MRVVVGYFGLTRSLRFTAPAIRGNILAPLRQHGFDILQVGHFNLPERIDNPRSGEAGIVPDRGEAALLDLDLCWIEPQRDGAIAREYELASAFPDAFADGYASLRNLCHQLRSLDRLWSLITLAAPDPADLVIFLRPDLLYLDRLDPPTTLAPLLADACDLVVPSWQGWGGINDRFAFATAAAAGIYASRWRCLVDACLDMGFLHAEHFLRQVVERAGLRTVTTELRAVRVRADGRISGNDATMLAAAGPPALAPAE